MPAKCLRNGPICQTHGTTWGYFKVSGQLCIIFQLTALHGMAIVINDLKFFQPCSINFYNRKLWKTAENFHYLLLLNDPILGLWISFGVL